MEEKIKNSKDIVIITGLSGAGRSHTSGVFEDLGYFVIDNVPPQIIPSLITITSNLNSTVKKLAIVTDMRSGEYFNQLNGVLDSINNDGIDFTILFLEANNKQLIKRYETSRRPHPLQNNNSLLGGILKEREKLYTLKLKSDYIIDTSNLTIHDLSRKINQIFSDKQTNKMNIQIISFGFKHGTPIDSNFVIDVRFLPNPYWIDNLRDKTGNDKEVFDFVFKQRTTNEFIENFAKLILSVVDKFIHENKKYITLAVGCTGGRHRSVAVAAKLKKLLTKPHIDVSISARDIHKDVKS
ncbi:MAG: RNase adapter RapZ [Bifidobacteriaceae bacterium]|nr:RNase adapter RapZ [Bifidobacteriaceae bacterium]